MEIKTLFVSRLFTCVFVCSGLVLSVAAGSLSVPSIFPQDVQIIRAAGAPAFTVRYTGVKASRIEIKLNGVSLGFRAVDSTKSEGEVSISLDVNRLQHGDNLVEAVVFDSSGKQAATQHTVITVERGQASPVSIKFPKTGDTVMGTVQIEVGFGVQSRENYISFFVNKEFRSMKNFPPYTFHWDTTQEVNGWHEIEVWSYDETQTTRKSPVIRVFVQNPGGRTERIIPTEVLNTLPSDPLLSGITGAIKGIRATTGAMATAVTNLTPPPAILPVLEPPVIKPQVSGSKGLKMSNVIVPEISGQRLTTPTLSKPAVKTETPVVSEPKLDPVTTGTSGIKNPTEAVAVNIPTEKALVKVDADTRFNKEGKYNIYLDGAQILFDVEPRVVHGLPIAPFRYLFEGLGGSVDWFGKERVVSAHGIGHEIWLQIGNPEAKIDGKPIRLDLAPYLERGRTLLPLSFFSDSLNLDVEYDPVTGHVLITQPKAKK
jgi:hypothetical protein